MRLKGVPALSGSVLLLILLAGCGGKDQNGKGEPLARVYDQYLYPADLKGVVGDQVSSEDSAALVREFIDNWIRHQLILRTAEANLPDRMQEIEEQAQDYRESLLIYAYERRWLAENVDTILNEDTLRNYLVAHRSEFILKNDIYKFSYAIMPADMSGYDTLKNWFTRDISGFRNELELFCQSHCKNYLFESPLWYDYNSLFNLLPLPIFEQGRLRTTAVQEYADSENRYLVRVHEYVIGGNPAPFEYVKEDIRKILINQQKMDLLKGNYSRMYQDALQRNNAEIYQP